MKSLKLIFALFILFTIFSCDKENSSIDEITDDNVANETITADIDIFSPKSYSHFSKKEKGQRDGLLEPSIEMIEAIEDLIYIYESESPFLETLTENLGYFDWNNSFLNYEDEEKYFISVPLRRANVVTATLRTGTRNGQIEYIDLISQNDINELLIETSTASKINNLHTILEFAMFQLLVESNVDDDINDWFVNYSNLKHTEHSDSRGFFCWIMSYYTEYANFITGVDTDGSIFEDIRDWFEVVTEQECIYIDESIDLPGSPPNPFDDEDDFIDNNGEDSDETDEDCLNSHGFTRADKQFLAGLDCDVLDCLSSNPELKDKIVEARKTGFTDPCQPNKTTEELIKDLLGDVNGIKGCPSANQFEAALDGVDKITPNPSLEADCPKVYCILQKVLKAGGDNIFNSICSISDSKNFNFNIKLGEASFTTYSTTSPNDINITIDRELCETSDPINLAETLLHEAIHGIIYANYTGDFDSNISNSEAWLSIIQTQYNGDSHAFITDYLLGPISETLWKLNGQIGQPSDYWGVILNGLYTSIFEGQVVYNQVIVDWVNDPDLGLNPNSLSIEEWISSEMQYYTDVIQNNEEGYALNFDCQ